ncbi:MAG: 50S ribosomal protein L11 methyltransferase, partial [Proteobacteria bacterium]|nr:50S ribosomal protein L11 methyltransferase [Pseudomonadota bacterium]
MIRRRLPPEDLVIYEVRGEWDEAERGELGSGFLGFWIEGGYTFLFFSALADGEVERLLAAARGLELRYVHRMKYSQWQDGAGFAAFSVGPLAIVPAWEEVPDKPGRRVVRIDPGLAFGFGGHPTTRACLEALVRIYSRERPARVLDLGAGTGVLALAAARLGATQALAVEYSHLAAETATGNVELNGLQDVVRVIRGRAEDHLDFQAELVMANLHFRV